MVLGGHGECFHGVDELSAFEEPDKEVLGGFHIDGQLGYFAAVNVVEIDEDCYCVDGGTEYFELVVAAEGGQGDREHRHCLFVE